jgi:hypothetical protein
MEEDQSQDRGVEGDKEEVGVARETPAYNKVPPAVVRETSREDQEVVKQVIDMLITKVQE